MKNDCILCEGIQQQKETLNNAHHTLRDLTIHAMHIIMYPIIDVFERKMLHPSGFTFSNYFCHFRP